MSDQQTSENDGVLKTLLQPRALLIIAAMGLFYSIACFDFPAMNLFGKILTASLCMFAYGFVVGYNPKSEDPSLRRVTLNATVLFVIANNVIFTSWLVGIMKLPVDQRYPSMLKPTYILTFLLLAVSVAGAYHIGSALFRQLYPDKATIPLTPEEREEMSVPAPPIWKTLGKPFIVIITITAAGMVTSYFFPKIAIKIILCYTLLLISYVSFLIGMRKNNGEVSSSRFPIVLGIIGPVAAFIGSYGGAKTQDLRHLIFALKFSAIMAAACWLPAIAARYVFSKDTNPEPDA